MYGKVNIDSINYSGLSQIQIGDGEKITLSNDDVLILTGKEGNITPPEEENVETPVTEEVNDEPVAIEETEEESTEASVPPNEPNTITPVMMSIDGDRTISLGIGRLKSFKEEFKWLLYESLKDGEISGIGGNPSVERENGALLIDNRNYLIADFEDYVSKTELTALEARISALEARINELEGDSTLEGDSATTN